MKFKTLKYKLSEGKYSNIDDQKQGKIYDFFLMVYNYHEGKIIINTNVVNQINGNTELLNHNLLILLEDFDAPYLDQIKDELGHIMHKLKFPVFDRIKSDIKLPSDRQLSDYFTRQFCKYDSNLAFTDYDFTIAEGEMVLLPY